MHSYALSGIMSQISEKKAFHHGNLKEACIELGLQIILEEGIENLSLRELARRLEVSKTAPYKHFPTKEDLLAAISQAGLAHFASRLTHVLNQPELEPYERLSKTAQAYFDYVLEYPAFYRLFASNVIQDVSKYPELQKAVNEPFRSLVTLIEQFRMQGVVKIEDSFQGALSLISMVHGFCSLVLENRVQFIGLTNDHLRVRLEKNIELIWKSFQ